MLTRSRIIQGASGLAGNPPNEPLPTGIPEWLRYETAADLETELMRDMNLSTENRTLASYPVRLRQGQREFVISQSGLENVSYVALRHNDSPDMVPDPIEIGNVGTIDGSAQDGRRVVAFYDDKPQRGIVSWNPSGNEVLTLWYDRSPVTDPSADQANFRIADSYVPLLKLLLAAAMREMLDKPIGKMLESRIVRGMAQWQKFVNKSGQQGVVQKTTQWRPGRYGRGQSQWASEFPVSFE
jgi:hypothetical protein